MNTAAEKLQAANMASKAIDHDQMELTEASRMVLVGMIRGEMKTAVAEGIQEAMTPTVIRLFWSVGLEMAQEQARIKAGRFILDGMWAAAKRGFWFMVLLSALYAIGGWSMVVTAWKALTASKPA